MGTQVGIVGVAVAVVSLVFAALQTRAAHRQAHAAEDQVKRMRLEHEEAAVAQ